MASSVFSLIVPAIMGFMGLKAAKEQAAAVDRATAQARESALAQEQRALKAEKQGEMEMNRANRKSPNANAILSAAQQAGRAGASGTMLTGPTGVDPNQLQLGRSSLLGA
jgi:hypothetical protein